MSPRLPNTNREKESPRTSDTQLDQSITSELEKKSRLLKPLWFQRPQENSQLRMQWRKDSSWRLQQTRWEINCLVNLSNIIIFIWSNLITKILFLKVNKLSG
jgi:hypothetical protein